MAWLFVYGTLLQEVDHSMHQLLREHADYHSTGRMQGALYEVGSYPGAIYSDRTGDWVIGELYRIRNPAPLLRQLDRYEGCSVLMPEPHEYQRRQVPIQFPGGHSRLAWVYLYALDTAPLQRIPSGDYLKYLNRGRR